MAAQGKRGKSRSKSHKGDVRGALLALLAREKTVVDRRTRERETRYLTQREAAGMLRISTRTLRRWKNEGVTPARSSRPALKRLKREAARENRSVSAALAADRRKHKSALRVDRKRLPALPRMHRRELRRYKFDRAKGKTVPTGETFASNWANYDVRGWTFKENASLLVQAWRAGHPFQFIYEVPSGGQLPKSGGKPARTVRKRTRASTAPINPGAFETEEELLDFLHGYIEFEQTRKGRRLLYIAVDDNKLRGK